MQNFIAKNSLFLNQGKSNNSLVLLANPEIQAVSGGFHAWRDLGTVGIAVMEAVALYNNAGIGSRYFYCAAIISLVFAAEALIHKGDPAKAADSLIAKTFITFSTSFLLYFAPSIVGVEPSLNLPGHYHSACMKKRKKK